MAVIAMNFKNWRVKFWRWVYAKIRNSVYIIYRWHLVKDFFIVKIEMKWFFVWGHYKEADWFLFYQCFEVRDNYLKVWATFLQDLFHIHFIYGRKSNCKWGKNRRIDQRSAHEFKVMVNWRFTTSVDQFLSEKVYFWICANFVRDFRY